MSGMSDIALWAGLTVLVVGGLAYIVVPRRVARLFSRRGSAADAHEQTGLLRALGVIMVILGIAAFMLVSA